MQNNYRDVTVREFAALIKNGVAENDLIEICKRSKLTEDQTDKLIRDARALVEVKTVQEAVPYGFSNFVGES